MRHAHLAALLIAAGCSRTFTGEAVQPNPIAKPTETLRSSEKISIVTGDMDLWAPEAANGLGASQYMRKRRYPLHNEASFTIVSRDRLRFHLQIDHKWEEYADLNTWQVVLVDDRGRTWVPESVEHAHTKLITRMWDWEQQRAICDARGRDGIGNCINTVGHDENSGWENRQPLGTLTVFRGRADFVFYDRDMMTATMRWMKLTVKRRSGETFEFTWRFEDTVASE
jgi:hypothetical protein